METEKNGQWNADIKRRVVICVLILLFGLVVMKLLGSLKKPPAEAETSEVALQVETVVVEKTDYPVTIAGYGEVRALKVVPIAPEIAGKVVATHPRLEAGEVIPEGELLFKIDDRDYQTAVTTGRQRLAVLKKSSALAEKDYDRVSRLFTENNVGTASGVDMAEKAMLAANDLVLQVSQALEMAEINLARCQVKAPFDGRISQVSIETGQFVSPGQPIVTLVDDSALEIHVPVDSRDARRWLQFEDEGEAVADANWFPVVSRVPCVIQWTEGDANTTWSGRLERTVRFDQTTRTLTVAVRVDPPETAPGAETLPLVEGMFCRVTIPGKTMQNVARLPRKAVSFENTAYLAVNNRLKTVPVTVVRKEDNFVYVSDGIKNGDQVLITRLIDPLENTRLIIANKSTSSAKPIKTAEPEPQTPETTDGQS